MIIDGRIKVYILQMILIEKQQKYQHYHQMKQINESTLQVNKFYHLIKVEYQSKLDLHIHNLEKEAKIIEEHRENKEKHLKNDWENNQL